MAAIRRIIPLRTELRERLILQTQALVTASVVASLIVAAVQGLLGGVIAFGSAGLVLGPVLIATAVGLFKAFTFDGELPSRPA
jgi:hypothetical protein